jgi:hypothetical protein
MSDLPFATPSEARKVWEGMDRPSSRRVARKVSQSGRPVSHETVNRWRRQGWRSVEDEPQHPLEIARDHLDDAVPLLTGDPMTTARVVVEQSTERDKLDKLTDGELLREAARSLAIAVIVVARAFLRQPEAVVNKPGELAMLFRSLAECAQAATAVLAKALNADAASPSS